MSDMYRQIFTPTENNSSIPPITIPREWYGKEVEMIVFPVTTETESKIKKKKEEKLMELYGAWKSEKPAEEIIEEICSSRTSGKTRFLEKL
jgi:hypothetical protein